MRLVAFCFLLFLILPPIADAQTPDLVMGTIPIGSDENQTLYATVGSIGTEACVLEWTVVDGRATGRCQGTPSGPGEEPPHFALAWYDLTESTPLHAQVKSRTDAEYSLSCAWGEPGGDPVGVVGEASIRGDYDFGHHLPDAPAVALHLILTEGKCDWDVTFVIEWGADVASDQSSFGSIKALYH